MTPLTPFNEKINSVEVYRSLNSLFHIPNYSFTHEKRKTSHKGGGLGIYVHKTLDFKILLNLAKNTENIETFTIEIQNKIPKTF